MRVGFGYDAHRLQAAGTASSIRLGGVDVPFDRAIEAHSDGDVVLHALCDALLGACALGDIGMHFPDSDPSWRGADSRRLLRACIEKVSATGCQLSNVDITLIAERPRVRTHVDAMREAIAADTGLGVDRVSVKATTTERMGFVGREEGIAAEAVALVEERNAV